MDGNFIISQAKKPYLRLEDGLVKKMFIFKY